jgi:radical SAM protein with 4Fe4S-binding SPASM domain
MYDPRFNEGNLRERTLRDIWDDPRAFAYNRQFRTDLLSGKCASCAHGAVCAAGCRSYNWFAGGKLYESPLCARKDCENANFS